MPAEHVSDLRLRHHAAVLDGELEFARDWDQPCLGFNIFLTLTARTTAKLAGLQARILRLEPDLLTVPQSALHISVGWLVPVQYDFATPKDTIWAEHAAEWRAGLRAALADLAPICLTYRNVVATNAAIIAVAWPAQQVNAIRAQLMDTLWLPGPFGSGSLVHTTLFRYRRGLADPARLLAWLADADVRIDATVTEIRVIRETRFPALAFDVLDRFRCEPQEPSRRALL